VLSAAAGSASRLKWPYRDAAYPFEIEQEVSALRAQIAPARAPWQLTRTTTAQPAGAVGALGAFCARGKFGSLGQLAYWCVSRRGHASAAAACRSLTLAQRVVQGQRLHQGGDQVRQGPARARRRRGLNGAARVMLIIIINSKNNSSEVLKVGFYQRTHPALATCEKYAN
jgi:hypothetical protein